MYTIRLKRINIEVLLKLLILIGFTCFFYDIVQTGKVLLYVNPRIIPYIKFGIVAMILLSLFIARDLFKTKRKVNINPYLFFIVPLIMAIMIPTASVSSKSMSLMNAKSTQKIADSKQKNSTDTTITNQNQVTGSSTQTNTSKPDSALKMHGDTIVVGDNTYVKWIGEISDNMAKYDGKKIELTGFVFKDDYFKANEFVPARFMMSCCTADLQPVGFMCHYDKAKSLKQDTWIFVTGKIKVIDYNGEKTPIIVAESIKNTVKPANDYVYPF